MARTCRPYSRTRAPYGTIECHLARANPHWKDLAAGGEALMIFQGPDGYITPNWYPSKAQHGKTVPTWNYAIVHAYGCPAVMQDKDWLRRHVGELTDQQEAGEAAPWALSDAPESYVDVMLRGIVGFRFAIARVSDYADSVALMRGEAVERGELRRRFTALVRNWVALVNKQNQ